MITDEPYFFDKNNKNIKKILKKQGNKTCRDKIHDETLLSSINKFDFGYVVLENKASIDDKKDNINSKYLLVSFILFRIDFIVNESFMFIDLLCSNINYKENNYGSKLLDLCCDYAKHKKIGFIHLHAINESKLIELYMRYGFTIVAPINNNKGEIKVYLMKKNILE